jgi:hypothetical protein
METMESIVASLNELLEAENPAEEKFRELISQAKAKEIIILKFLDFEYYNEDRKEHAKREKVVEVNLQNFGSAANWREKEKKIDKYIAFRKELEVTRSMFFYREEYLLYLYMGTARNDLVIRFWLKEFLEKNRD